MKGIEIDRSKPLKAQPHTGHNRWHPDIKANLEVEAGEDVVLRARCARRTVQSGYDSRRSG